MCVCVRACACACLILCGLETSTMRRPRPELGCCVTETKVADIWRKYPRLNVPELN